MVLVCDDCEGKEGVKPVVLEINTPDLLENYARLVTFKGDLCRKCRQKLFKGLYDFKGLKCSFTSYNGKTPYDNQGG